MPRRKSQKNSKTDHVNPSLHGSAIASRVDSWNTEKLFYCNQTCCYCDRDVIFQCLFQWEWLMAPYTTHDMLEHFHKNLETKEKHVGGHFRTSVHAVFSYMMIYVHKTYWAPDTPNRWSPRIAKTDHSYPSFCCSVVAPQVNSWNKVKLFCWNYACCYCVIDVFFYCLLLWERWWHHTQHTPFPQKTGKTEERVGCTGNRRKQTHKMTFAKDWKK